MKRAFLSLVAGSGGFAPFRVVHRRQALIVTYHRFANADSTAGAIGTHTLAEQLDYLTRHYHVVPLSWLAGRLQRGGLSARLAAVTVDDGYEDVHQIALPFFQHFHVPATVFAVTGFLDGACWIWTDTVRHVLARTQADRLAVTLAGHSIEMPLGTSAERRTAAAQVNALLKTLPDATAQDAIPALAERLAVPIPDAPPAGMRALTWPQARALVEAGLEIGSHTVTHPVLTNVGAARLRHEVEASRRRLQEALSVPIALFCYPNGGVDRAVRAAVARAGYAAAVTTVGGFNDARTDLLALKRIHTEPEMAHFIQSTSGFEQFKGRLRALRGRRPIDGRLKPAPT